MTTTFAIRTAELMPALPAAQLSAAQAPLCGTALSGLGASYAGARMRTVSNGLALDTVPSLVDESHVAVIGIRQVSPVSGTTVVAPVTSGTAVFGKGDVPALRTWRPPV